MTAFGAGVRFMPTFEVEIAHRDTGATSLVQVEAISSAAAAQEACADYPKHRIGRVQLREVPEPRHHPPPEAPFSPGKGMIICPNPNCGYKGPVKRIARGSRVVAILLLLFLFVPGLLYILFCGGYRYVCPRCGMQIGRDG